MRPHHRAHALDDTRQVAVEARHRRGVAAVGGGGAYSSVMDVTPAATSTPTWACTESTAMNERATEENNLLTINDRFYVLTELRNEGALI